MEPRTKRWLMGCGLGCGAVLLVGVGSCVSFVVWLNSPGDVLEPERLVGGDTTAYVEWTLRLEDPGTREAADQLIGVLQDSRGSVPLLPSILGERLTEFQNRRDEREIRKLFPVVLVWTLHQGTAEDPDLHLLSASLRGLDHQLVLADWIMGLFLGRAREADVVRHGPEKIYVLHPDEGDRDVIVFIHRGDLFFTTSLETARVAVDRLTAAAPSAAPAPVDEWLRRTSEQPLRGALSNARGELRRVWESFLDENVTELVPDEGWRAIEGVTLGGNFTDASTLEIVADIHMAGAEDAAAAGPALIAAVERFLDDTPLEMRSSSVEGRRVSVTLELSAEIESLGSALDDAVDGN